MAPEAHEDQLRRVLRHGDAGPGRARLGHRQAVRQGSGDRGGGGGELISRICDWMYAQAKEKCTCRAPSFITGCDHMAETGDNHVAECTCQTDECPWTHHTGVFL